MRVDIYEAQSMDGVVVLATGHADEVTAFKEWMVDNGIDYSNYADQFTGMTHMEHNGMKNFWGFILDPDHEHRVLIKLRWK